MVLERVIKVLAEYKEIDPSAVSQEFTFEEMEIDSLDIAELLMSLEDEFEVELEMDEKLKTVGDLAEHIKKAIE